MAGREWWGTLCRWEAAWGCSRCSLSASFVPCCASLGQHRGLGLVSAWKPGSWVCCVLGRCWQGCPQDPLPSTPTPIPASSAAWVAGASWGLPSGSPVMTLITQVSGSAVWGAGGPRGRVHMAPGQPTPGPSSSFVSLCPGRAGGGEGWARSQLAAGERWEAGDGAGREGAGGCTGVWAGVAGR